ncbi:MAG: HAMP domain-containing histidine kinase [Gammaproteobacteria bacterium]|nr:HAMP domain-containing histidine kinase [Gammaproteobacteria bacterium]
MARGRAAGARKRRWRCPCTAIQGLLGTVYGQLAAVLLALFGALVALVAVPESVPSRGVLLVALGLALAIALLLAWLITVPLRGLLRSLSEARDSGYRRLPRPAPRPASAEVFGIQRACREMADRVLADAGASGEAQARSQATLVQFFKELHDPLLAVQGEIHRLSGREGSLGSHARQAVLDAALHNVETAVRRVAEAGDLARLNAPDTRPRPESFALDALARGVVQRLRPQAGRRGVDVDVRAPSTLPLVSADHGLVEEGLARLVDHAVRYCPAGSRVRVTLQEGAEGVRTQVRRIEADLGSEAVAAPPGAGTVSSTAASADEGLGIAIARRVAELHGGALTVTVAPGLHASYAFTLPRADQARAP